MFLDTLQYNQLREVTTSIVEDAQMLIKTQKKTGVYLIKKKI